MASGELRLRFLQATETMGDGSSVRGGFFWQVGDLRVRVAEQGDPATCLEAWKVEDLAKRVKSGLVHGITAPAVRPTHWCYSSMAGPNAGSSLPGNAKTSRAAARSSFTGSRGAGSCLLCRAGSAAL